MAQTRAQLRRKIAQMLEDITFLTATQAGTTTEFVDTVSLTTGLENAKNRDIVFTDSHASNTGLVRVVTNADHAAGYVAFDALPQAIAEGDEAELYNFRSRGWRVAEYNKAIDQARLDAYPLYKEPVRIAPSAFADGMATVPASIEYISDVQYYRSASIPASIPFSSRPYGSGWSILDGGIFIGDTRFTVPFGTAFDAGDAYLIGYGPPSAMTSDTDTTDINPEWLANKAAEILCMGALSRDQGNAYRASTFGQKAERHLSSIRTRLPGNTKRVR